MLSICTVAALQFVLIEYNNLMAIRDKSGDDDDDDDYDYYYDFIYFFVCV